MKVQNMKSARGNKVANQFIITDDEKWLSRGELVDNYYRTWTIVKEWEM